MPLRKIKEYTKEERCPHPEHHVPRNMVLTAGEWEWECPHCGEITSIHIPLVSDSAYTIPAIPCGDGVIYNN